MNTAIDKIHQLLLNHRDEAYCQSISVLVPSDKPILGVRVPQIRDLVKQWHKANELTFEQAVALVDGLFERQIREELLFAVFLLQKYKKQFVPELFEKIDRWVERIENWEVCDQLAVVATPLCLTNPENFKVLQRWTKSRNHWRRRIVLAIGASLNHHGLSHVEPVMSWCEELYADNHPMVQKAWHWAVREVSKKDRDYVFAWLLQRRNMIKKTLLRQAAQKLETQQIEQLLAI